MSMDPSKDSLIAGADDLASNEQSQELSFTDQGIHISLTHRKLDPSTIIGKVKSDKAGAVLLFAGMCLSNDGSSQDCVADIIF